MEMSEEVEPSTSPSIVQLPLSQNSQQCGLASINIAQDCQTQVYELQAKVKNSGFFFFSLSQVMCLGKGRDGITIVQDCQTKVYEMQAATEFFFTNVTELQAKAEKV